METISGPISTLIESVMDLLGEHVPRDLTWPFLLITVGLAIVIWILRGGYGARGADGHIRKSGLIEFLLPKDIYTHVSARVDVSLYVFERLLRPLWVTTFLVSVAPFTEASIISGLLYTFP